MKRKVLLLVLLIIVILSFAFEHAEARPPWVRPPWRFGAYWVNYYPYYPAYYSNCWYPAYCYDPWWYDCWYDCWDPYYYCSYPPGWYVSFWMGWGFYSYYCYQPYNYYYTWRYYYPPPYYYGNYYVWHDYYYRDYYWDGYGRWRDHYNDYGKPYRTNHNGGEREYAYHEMNGGRKPPRDYENGKDLSDRGRTIHEDKGFELAKVDPLESMRKSKRPQEREKISSVFRKQPIEISPSKGNKKVIRYETVEQAHDDIFGVVERRESGEKKNKEEEQSYSKKGTEKRKAFEIRKRDEKKSDKKESESKKKSSSTKKSFSSGSRFSSSSKGTTSSRHQNKRSPSGSKKGGRRK